jgi:uncharacterized protein YggE
MGYYGDSDVIAVGAKGTCETEFTSATYRATVTTSAKTGPEAKEKARPIIEKIRQVVLAHADKAGIDTQRLKTQFSVDVEKNRNTGDFVGYQANYSASFTGKSVKAAPEVHDALTSIEGVQAPTPVYNVNEAQEVQAKAFADAVGKAQAKFAGQCVALGYSPDDYEVHSWSIQEEQPRGKTLSFSVNAADHVKPVGLEPGKASLDVTANLAYVRRKPTP